MRFDMPFVFLIGAASAAGIPRPNRAGWDVDHQSGSNRLLEAEKEIEHLEDKLLHDLEELEHKQQGHQRPGPYWRPSPPSLTPSESSVAGYESSSYTDSTSILAISVAQSSGSAETTASASSILTSSGTISVGIVSYFTSAANTTSALQSLSSVAASLSSVLSSVSSVNATITLATSSSQATTSTLNVPVTSTISLLATTSASFSTSYSPSTAAVYASSTTFNNISSNSSSSSSTFNTSLSLSSTAYPLSNCTATTLPGTQPAEFTNTSSTVASGTASSSSLFSVNSTSSLATSTVSARPTISVNTTSAKPTGTASSKPFDAGNSTSIPSSGTASAFTMAPTALASVSAAANTTSASYCQSLCSSLTLDTDYSTIPISCEAIAANTEYTLTGGQATAQCGSTSITSFTPEVDICRVTLSITTSGESETYTEVWLPNNSTDAWNGRSLNTDNGGANGCVHYVDMEYVTSLGFAAIGDNGGHNSSAFDAGWMYFQNEVILDWVYRARHASVQAGKQVVDQFYGQAPSYSYYLGCSTGGQQGLHSAQYYPDDFDGIIAGSAAADFNHLQAWSGRFVQLTGTNSSDARFLTEDQWIFVQSYIFDQCDEALDGVNDGILEDPTICQFDATAIPVCNDTTTDNCLTSTQINTVEQVFTELYNEDGELLYPALLYGSQVDAFRLGQLSGSIQAISSDWYGGGVYNNSYYDALNMNQTDYATADSEDELHGYVSSFNGDLSAFQSAGGKLLMYHGMADPLVSGGNSQRYYLKVAQTLGADNTALDPFFRYFRISGMAHCGVGGISGAGAWMFGQSGAAAVPGVEDNVIWNMVDWVENGNAPDTITGTKFWYDTPSLGLEFERAHCRFPYRTTYSGSGDSTDPANWGCTFIDDWQTCAVGAHPRLCNVDGSFT